MKHLLAVDLGGAFLFILRLEVAHHRSRPHHSRLHLITTSGY
jgi:hypothetical protein